MFTKSEISKFLYLDIETACCFPSISELEKDNKRLYDLWKKRDSYYRGAYPEMKDKTCDEVFKSKAGLEPEFSKVVCISFGSFSEGIEPRLISFNGGPDDELDILSKSHKVISNAAAKNWKLCGHNIKGFDIPFIARKLVYNSIKLPQNLEIWNKKPWEVGVIDTSEIFSFGSWMHQKYLSLDLLSCSLGIESPKEIMDGSLVNDAFWVDKDYDKIKMYCESDVSTVMKIMKHITFDL